MVALTHALVLDLFYHGFGKSCLTITAKSEDLTAHADGIRDTEAAEALAARHDQWGEQLPDETVDVWPFLVALDGDSRIALLAHCVSLTVNAVKVPWERAVSRIEVAEGLAEAVNLDMTATWTATARSYFGRVTKAHIVQAVGEAVSPEAAERIRPMKKADMADAAEQLVAGTGWLPSLLRITKAKAEPEAGEMVEPEDEDQPHYAVAAE